MNSVLHFTTRQTLFLYTLLLSWAVPVLSSATVNFELVLWHGYNFYYGDAILSASSPAPVTYHRVESPSGLIWQNTGNNNSGSSASITNDVQDLIHETTNGVWTLTMNVGDVSEEQYTFSATMAGVTSNLFGDINLSSPSYGATVTTNQPLIEWTGPSNLPTLSINISDDGPPHAVHDIATLPSTSTNWTPSVAIPGGTQSIFMNYRSNDYSGITFSVPTNVVGGATQTNWTSTADISTYLYSTFVVPTVGSPLGDAVDAPELVWTTGGDWDWVPQTVITDDGIDAALSELPDNLLNESWIETTVYGPGTIDFAWYIDADYSDWMLFEIDGNYEYDIYGQDGWDYPGGIEVPPGEVTLRWTFYNDDDFQEFSDVAALDQVVFTAEEEPFEADLHLKLFRVSSGASQYIEVIPTLTPYPEYAEYELTSPNAQITDSSSGGYTSLKYPTFQAMVDEIEAGDWTLVFDPFGVYEEYTFTIDASALNSNEIAAVIIHNPVDGSTGVATNTTFTWQGPIPTGYNSVVATDYDESNAIVGSQVLAPTATNWMHSGSLPSETNNINVTYNDFSYPGFIFSWPEDGGSNPIEYWDANVQLTSYGRSEFVVGSGFIALPVTLLPTEITGGNMNLTFVSQPGATHTVNYSTNLVTGPWMMATNFPGDGGTNMIMLPPTNLAAYFRVDTE